MFDRGRTKGSGLLAVLGIAAVVAAGCGSSGGNGSDGGSGGGSATGTNGAPLTLEGEQVASASLYSAAKKEGSLTVYTAVPEGSKELFKAFTNDTGIQVKGISLPTDKLTQRILSESSAGTLPADVISMPDRSIWKKFVKKGLLQAYTPPQESEIPNKYETSSKLYHSRSLAANPLAYNTKLVKKPPKSWRDLLDARFAGNKVGLKPASAGSVGWVEAVYSRTKFGLDYWKKLAAQKPSLQTSSSAIGQVLARGEVSVAISRPGVIGSLQEQGAPVKMVWPSQGTPMVVYSIGLVAHSSHPNAAKVFENWSLSKRGQTLYAADAGDYAVNPKAPAPKANGKSLPRLKSVHPWIATTDQWTSTRTAWTKQWGKIFWVSVDSEEGWRPSPIRLAATPTL